MRVVGGVSDRDRVEIRRGTAAAKISRPQETKSPDVAVGAFHKQGADFGRSETETGIRGPCATARIEDDPYLCVVGGENRIGVRRRTRLCVTINGYVVVGNNRVTNLAARVWR